MLRFKNGQKLLFFAGVLILSLLSLCNFDEAQAQKIDLDTLEIDQGIKQANRNVSIIARISTTTVFRGDQLTLRIIGRIDPGHHLYSIRQQGGFAPDPTKIVITDPFLNAVSEMDESATLLIHDDAFGTPLQVHQDDFWISLRYHVSGKANPGVYQLRGYLIYQICNNRICSLPLKNHFHEKITISN
ncbi:MAG: hypothetical protein HN580_18340 [Deltaproteobacteria bacterium]|nr:hypothetical protein [Deltaproteobacteria bacterium]